MRVAPKCSPCSTRTRARKPNASSGATAIHRTRREEPHLAILISFDIDGTLEVGDPPGPLTMDMVRNAQANGCLIGSCSDRIASSQRRIWDDHDIQVDFVCVKGSPMEELRLEYMKTKFDAEEYWHIGDREDLDRQMALSVGFDFLWPDEATEKPWFTPNGA